MATCEICPHCREVVHIGHFTGSEGKRVRYGSVICEYKGRTGLVEIMLCPEAQRAYADDGELPDGEALV